MHKALIAIVGPSGSGKSTSLRNLPADTTRMLDLERKGFPFKGAEKFDTKPISNIAEFDSALKAALDDKSVTHIVVESFTKYCEMLYRLMAQSYKGYEVYANYNKAIGLMLDRVKNDHASVIFTAIDEIVSIPNTDGTTTAQRRMSVVKGKEWEGKVEKEMLMVFFTSAKRGADGRIAYSFETNTDGVHSAKTPMGMFDDLLIPNDINAALEAARRYYGG